MQDASSGNRWMNFSIFIVLFYPKYYYEHTEFHPNRQMFFCIYISLKHPFMSNKLTNIMRIIILINLEFEKYEVYY